jgi:type IV fimbrial biogenesis protein FimT
MHKLTSPRRPAVRGFTIIELMVAIAIVAILATLAGPSMTDLIDRRRLASQTEAITDLLQIARSEAIKHSSNSAQREVAVTISPGTNWFIGLNNNPNGCADAATCVLNEGGANVSRFLSNTACSGCKIVEPTQATVVVFSFRGLVEGGANDRRVVVESPRGYRTRVTLSPIGRVSVCTPTAGMTGYKAC